MRIQNKKKMMVLTVVFSIMAMVSLVYLAEAQGQGLSEKNDEPQGYNASELKDPFSGGIKSAKPKDILPAPVLEQPQRPLPALAVQGVIWGGNPAQAIINDRVVKSGDVIKASQGSGNPEGGLGDIKISSIDKDGVRVIFDNREYRLASPSMVGVGDDKESKSR